MNLLLRICYRSYRPLLSHVTPFLCDPFIYHYSGFLIWCFLPPWTAFRQDGEWLSCSHSGEKQRFSWREELPAVWCAPSHLGKGGEVTRQQIATTQIPNSGPQDRKPDHCIHLAQASGFSLQIPECGKDGPCLGHTRLHGWNMHSDPRSQKHFQISQCRLQVGDVLSNGLLAVLANARKKRVMQLVTPSSGFSPGIEQISYTARSQFG